VLDDKLLRAQIAEEEKLKPLNEQVNRTRNPGSDASVGNEKYGSWRQI